MTTSLLEIKRLKEEDVRFFKYALSEDVYFHVLYVKTSDNETIILDERPFKFFRLWLNDVSKRLFGLKELFLISVFLTSLLLVVLAIFVIWGIHYIYFLPSLGFILLSCYVSTQILFIRAKEYCIYEIEFDNSQDNYFHQNCISKLRQIYPNNSSTIGLCRGFFRLLDYLERSNDDVDFIINENKNLKKVILEIEGTYSKNMKRIGIFNLKK